MRGGYLPSSALVDLLSAYQNEADQKVWEIISLTIAELKKFVDQDIAAEQMLRSFVGRLARPQFERLGWEPLANETEHDTKLRTIIIGCMLYSEDIETVRRAHELYETSPIEQLNPELRPLILSAVVRHDKEPRHIIDNLIKYYKNTPSADIRSDITTGVTATRDIDQIKRLIKLLTDTHTIRSQDTVYWFVDLLRNRYGREQTWRWLRDNWKWIEKTFASDKSHDYFPRYAASLLMTRAQLEEYKTFFMPLRSDNSLTRAIDMGILDLEGKLEIIERDAPGVIAALSNV